MINATYYQVTFSSICQWQHYYSQRERESAVWLFNRVLKYPPIFSPLVLDFFFWIYVYHMGLKIVRPKQSGLSFQKALRIWIDHRSLWCWRAVPEVFKLFDFKAPCFPNQYLKTECPLNTFQDSRSYKSWMLFRFCILSNQWIYLPAIRDLQDKDWG